MKGFVILLLSVIFVALIAGSTESVDADHSLGGQGIFIDENHVNIASTKDSKYLMHLQVVVRDEGRLVSVSEVTHGSYIPHKISDDVFDEYFGKKEIVIIDKMKYEKAQFTLSHDVQQFSFATSSQDVQSFWALEICINTKEHGDEQGISCMSVFQTMTPHISLGENDNFTLNWTILREMN